MPKRPDSFDDFSVDEIIAEIKGMADGQRPPVISAPENQDALIDAIAKEVREPVVKPPSPEPKAAKPSPPTPETDGDAPEPVAFKLRRPPRQPDGRQAVTPAATEPPPPARPSPEAAPEPPAPAPEPDIRLAPPPKAEGRRVAPSPPTPAQEIFAEEARIERDKKAPWRTRPEPVFAPTADPEQDTQEFEITLEGPGEDTGAFEPAPQDEAEPGKRLGYDFINSVFEDAQTAVRVLDRRISAMSARVLLMVPLLLAATYMTLCLPRSWPMPFGFTYINHPYLYLLVLAVLHGAAILLAGEVTAAGLMRLLRLRPTLDSLTLFCQLCILAHTVSIVLKPQWGGYLPYSCVGILGCMMALLAKRQRAEGLRRTYRASLLGTMPTAVKQVETGGMSLAVKTEENAWVDMETIARPDPTERLGELIAPLAMVAIIGLGVVASFGQQQPDRLLWCLAALSAASAPVSLALSASMPTRRISKKLFTSGSCLINPDRTRRLARCDTTVLRDGDVFPAGSVEISGMKIAQSFKMEAVLGCATAMMQEIGGGLAHAFADFARQQYIPALRAENLRFYESGGLSADVQGHHVLLGSASYLMRMGIRVTEGVKLPSSLFIAINGGFAGIFSIKYGVQSQPYAAFRVLRASRISPLLATRDMNITQAYVESRFDLRAAVTEYPDMSERIRLSEPGLGGEADTLAFLSRDGMLPFAEVVAAAKRQRSAIRFGQVIGLIALAAGLLLMYFLAYNLKVASAAPHNVLLFQLLWLVPIWLGSALITRL